ncbi:MAG: hypothetical protein KTR21_03855, partial [Rhodobacteraceae bacterium]|nr:hypothetical protein [Paracoccaceae bacterium]
ATLKILLIRDAFETQPPAGAYPVLAEADRRFWARIGAKPSSALGRGEAVTRLERVGARVARVDVASGPEALISAPEFAWLDHG